METFSALLAFRAGNSPVPGESPAQRPVTRSFDVFFGMRLNQQLSKQWRCWWFETLPHSLRRHFNVKITLLCTICHLQLWDFCGRPCLFHISQSIVTVGTMTAGANPNMLKAGLGPCYDPFLHRNSNRAEISFCPYLNYIDHISAKIAYDTKTLMSWHVQNYIKTLQSGT